MASKKLQIEINADDFGRSATANAGIIAAFRQGLVTSTSIMANMPGYSEACDQIREYAFIRNVGVHLNVTEGKPLTDAIRDFPVFCNENGLFYITRWKARAAFTSKEKTALDEEVDAQIQKCLDDGIHPCKVDSHMHRHTNWEMGRIVIDAARKFNIPSVRLCGNCRQQNMLRRVFVMAYNYRLRLARLAGHQFFGAVADLNRCRNRLRGKVEVMVHPVLSSEGFLLDAESGRPLTEHVGWFRKFARPEVSDDA